MRVAVTNNGEAWKARFDGEEFTFPAGEEVVIPELAAMFFFAFGMDDFARARVLVRNGWQKMASADPQFGPEAARKRIMQFSFKALPDIERVKPVAKVLPPITKPAPPDAAQLREAGTSKVQIPGRKGPLAPLAAAR